MERTEIIPSTVYGAMWHKLYIPTLYVYTQQNSTKISRTIHKHAVLGPAKTTSKIVMRIPIKTTYSIKHKVTTEESENPLKAQ